MHETGSNVFVAHLNVIDDCEITGLKLGKKATEAYARAGELHKQLDRYAYGGPRIRFADVEVDQARAAGVAIEFERSVPLIVDRSLYRKLVEQAITRTVSELEAGVAERDAQRKASRQTRAAEKVADPLADAQRQWSAHLRVVAEQAHGVNLDVGAELLNGLATVDPSDLTVARFFVLGRYRPRTNYADSAAMPMRHRSAARRKALGQRNQPRGATCSWRGAGRGDPVVRDLRSCRGGDGEVRRGFVTACVSISAARRWLFRHQRRRCFGLPATVPAVGTSSLPLGESSRSYTRRAHASDVVATTTTAYLRIRKTRLVLATCEQAGRLESLTTLLERHQRALRREAGSGPAWRVQVIALARRPGRRLLRLRLLLRRRVGGVG
jgi:hypothetical protein